MVNGRVCHEYLSLHNGRCHIVCSGRSSYTARIMYGCAEIYVILGEGQLSERCKHIHTHTHRETTVQTLHKYLK